MARVSGPEVRRSTLVVSVLILTLLLADCASVGPKTIPRDQFGYGMSIADAKKAQLLFNVVRLRYLDAPVFLNVSSVINQYSLEGQVDLGLGFNTAITGDNTQALGGTGKWADRPTITYSPISGVEFSRSLLTPITPEALFALVQAGWQAEMILRLTVRSMNGIENEWAAPANRRLADPRFVQLLQTWTRLRNARAIGLRRESGEKSSRVVVFQLGEEYPEEVQRDLDFLFETLELDRSAGSYPLSYGLVRDEGDEIVVLTASILEIMNELAWRVEVPEQHLEEGRTASTFAGQSDGMEPLVRVHCAEEKPADSYVAIRERGYWFYIDDRDLISKRTFAILQVLLSLTDSGETARGPVVSITN